MKSLGKKSLQELYLGNKEAFDIILYDSVKEAAAALGAGNTLALFSVKNSGIGHCSKEAA